MSAEFLEQPPASVLDEIEDALEACRAAVVRIGHLGAAGAREVEQQVDLAALLGCRLSDQGREIVAIHGEDVVEALEVLGTDAPGADIRQRVAPPFRRRRRSVPRSV